MKNFIIEINKFPSICDHFITPEIRGACFCLFVFSHTLRVVGGNTEKNKTKQNTALESQGSSLPTKISLLPC